MPKLELLQGGMMLLRRAEGVSKEGSRTFRGGDSVWGVCWLLSWEVSY